MDFIHKSLHNSCTWSWPYHTKCSLLQNVLCLWTFNSFNRSICEKLMTENIIFPHSPYTRWHICCIQLFICTVHFVAVTICPNHGTNKGSLILTSVFPQRRWFSAAPKASWGFPLPPAPRWLHLGDRPSRCLIGIGHLCIAMLHPSSMFHLEQEALKWEKESSVNWIAQVLCLPRWVPGGICVG